jgi:lysophospholipase L1-like esterase
MAAVRRLAFAAVVPAILLGALAVLWIAYGERFLAPAGGRELNRLAWESTFVERGLDVPPAGPRDGYWGERLLPKARDALTGWREDAQRITGFLDVDDRGCQSLAGSGDGRRHVLIVGGSVAFGAYASSAPTTYFHRLGRRLEEAGAPADVTVCAAGAWKSRQELAALEARAAELRPDLIVLFDGLNDLTSGATSDALFGDRVPVPDGRTWSVHFHAHDYERRVADYLDNVRQAVRVSAGGSAGLLLVLQPSLAERREPSFLERRLLAASLEPHESKRALTDGYEAMRAGLRELAAASPGVEFLDLSRVFDTEEPTTFTDLWHFTDPGHEIVAAAMAPRIAELLRREPDPLR